jgi:4-amino-4-deoxy-L-arabinose transferase-like glycosyltransferase
MAQPRKFWMTQAVEAADQESPVAGEEPGPVASSTARAEAGAARRRWIGAATVLVFLLALAALVPTTADFGMAWDEPAYRYSQVISAQWWERLANVHSRTDLEALLSPDALLYFWPYGRFGINFHPPLAGQLNLAAHAAFGGWMKDIPSRRMASVIEFALTITVGFGFLARRYGMTAGLAMAGSLLLMPRLYGQAHLVDTDIPGLLLWVAATLAFWKGLYEEKARRWRVLVGVILGLAFVEKMAAVGVLVPLLGWLVAGHLVPGLRRSRRADWIDGLITTGLMLLPLGLAFLEIQSLQRQLPLPKQTNLFTDRPRSDFPGWILAVPLGVWVIRRLLGRLRPHSPLWGAERPALETWTAVLAFAPVVGWLGNPAWWREALPRLAHYYMLSNDRQHALPDIQILYFGQIYEYSLPWHNAWVLIGITVPLSILAAAVVGLGWSLVQFRRDRLQVYFLVHFLTFPILRMLPTPTHDGVRLFLPTFFFLAAYAGWGTAALTRSLAGRLRLRPGLVATVVGAGVLAPAAFELAHVHPFELSYYNALIGGPPGAWRRGFELTYWWESFTPSVLRELNRRLPLNAEVDFPNDLTNPMTFQELQELGALRGDIQLGGDIQKHSRRYDRFGYVWLQTQDSKASAFSRLLYAMRPWFAMEPPQLEGLRVATVADPVAVSRAWALELLLDAPDRSRPAPPAAPAWVRTYTPFLARFWGDGLKRAHRLEVNREVLDWARTDPQGLLEAARALAGRKRIKESRPAQWLIALMTSDPVAETVSFRRFLLDRLLKARPEGLVEGVEIMIAHPEDVERVLRRYGYTDPRSIGGYLDRDLASG